MSKVHRESGETRFMKLFGVTLEGDVYCACGMIHRGPVRGVYVYGMSFVFNCSCGRYRGLEQYFKDKREAIRSFLNFPG